MLIVQSKETVLLQVPPREINKCLRLNQEAHLA